MLLLLVLIAAIVYTVWRHRAKSRADDMKDKAHRALLREDREYREVLEAAQEEQRAGERYGRQRGRARLYVLDRLRQDGDISEEEWAQSVDAVRRQHRM